MQVYVLEAIQITLKEKKFLLSFILLAILFFVGMFSIPLQSIPGNDLAFQLALFGLQDYFLLGLLSCLSSLVVVMQVFIVREKFWSRSSGIGGMALGGVGVLSGIFSSLFASATCAMCLGALFSFLGFGTILLLAEYRWYILLGASVLLLLSLYFASRRIVEGCRSCVVEPIEGAANVSASSQ